VVESVLIRTSNVQESQTGVVRLSDDDPQILTHFLQFLYTGKYEEEHKGTEDSDASPEMSGPSHTEEHVEGSPNLLDEEWDGLEPPLPDMFTSLRVYVMADKFNVPELKRLSRVRLFAGMYGTHLTSSQFPALVEELYETTAKTDYLTREMPCRLLAAAYAEGSMEMAPMEDVMRRHGDLAVGVLKFTQMYHTPEVAFYEELAKRVKDHEGL
jgi:hypothetical protein